jgi:hypothetical protein
MPREFDELRPQSLPPSLNAPRQRDVIGDLISGMDRRRQRPPPSPYNPIDVDPTVGAMMDFTSSVGRYINPENWERMLRESPESQNIEDRRESDAILEKLNARHPIQRRQFGGKVDAGEAIITGEAGVEAFIPLAKRPQLPPGFRWKDQPIEAKPDAAYAPLQERPQLPPGFRWKDQPPPETAGAPAPSSGWLDRAGEAVRSAIMPGPIPAPPARVESTMAPPGGAIVPPMMASPGTPEPYRSPMAPPGGLVPPVPRAEQPPLPRVPQGPPVGFPARPPIVQRGGRWYTVDAEGNLITLEAAGRIQNGQSVE